MEIKHISDENDIVLLMIFQEKEEEPDETKSLQQAMLDYLAYNGASEPAYLVNLMISLFIFQNISWKSFLKCFNCLCLYLFECLLGSLNIDVTGKDKT